MIGDPFCATTHVDLFLRAKQRGINVQVIHNASIMNAVGCCGLHVYDFGPTISMCFFTETWKPQSWYEKIKKNRENNSHTLVLLDIRVKEISDENLKLKKKIYEPPRFMSCKVCAEQLLQTEKEKGGNAYDENTMCVGLARVGQKDQKIVYGSLK